MYVYVRIYVRMYVCMYVYVCIYVCMYVCMCVCTYICAYVRMYVRMYVHVCMCIHVCMYVRMYVHTECMWSYTCTQMHTVVQRDMECVYLGHSVLSELTKESWKMENISKIGPRQESLLDLNQGHHRFRNLVYSICPITFRAADIIFGVSECWSELNARRLTRPPLCLETSGASHPVRQYSLPAELTL